MDQQVAEDEKNQKNLRTDPQLEVVVEGKKQPLLNSGGGQTMGGGCKYNNNSNNMTTCKNSMQCTLLRGQQLMRMQVH